MGMGQVTYEIPILGGSSHLVSLLYNPSYRWSNPTYPIYNWGYNKLTKWEEPPSIWEDAYPAIAART